jgi:hypothetical protein
VAFRHLAQTTWALTLPGKTFLKRLGFHCRLVWRLEWETLKPETAPLPQIEQTLDITATIYPSGNSKIERAKIAPAPVLQILADRPCKNQACCHFFPTQLV